MTSKNNTPNEIRVRKRREAWRFEGWSSIPNHLVLRKDISWDAKGAFGWLSLAADDPEFDTDGQALANAGPKGRDHAQGMLRELERHGYLTRLRELNADTGLPEVVYELWPKPVPEEERTYQPSTRTSRKRTFPQDNPQKRNGQSLGPAQEDVDNSPPSDVAGGSASTDGDSVSPGQPPKTDGAGPGTSGPGTSGALTTSSRQTYSSSSSSPSMNEGSAEVGSEAKEEEEGNNQGERTQEAPGTDPEATALLDQHVRFKRGKYLKSEARQECERLLAEHRGAGWPDATLGRYLRDWSAQAHNPSRYLVDQLQALGTPPTQTQDRPQSTSGKTGTWGRSSDEARAQAKAILQLNMNRKGRGSDDPEDDRDPQALGDLLDREGA